MALTKEKQSSETNAIAGMPPFPRKRISWSFTPRFWQRFYQGLFVILLSTFLGSLASLSRITETAYLLTADQFSWMVLVQGDSLQNDEVGGRLRQLPGARNVKFVSSESAFEELQIDPLYMVETSAFEPADLPASWRVQWDARSVDFSLLPIFADDVRHLEGVLEVAYDPRQLELIHRLRTQWFAVLTSLWCAGLVAVFGSLLIIGRLVFFKPPHTWSWPALGRAVVRTELWWLVGCGIVWFFLSRTLPWPAALGGIAVGMMHHLWDALDHR